MHKYEEYNENLNGLYDCEPDICDGQINGHSSGGDSPYNHGWIESEPAYPVYGFGIGYAIRFNTVLDLQQGSRVLDVYRPASIFLLSTPYERHQIFRSLYTPASTGDPKGKNCIQMIPTNDDKTVNPVISFDFRAPLGIEPWDIFELDVIGEGNDEDNAITVRTDTLSTSSILTASSSPCHLLPLPLMCPDTRFLQLSGRIWMTSAGV